MSRLLGLKQCPIFKEAGDVKVTTDYGYKVSDYPNVGQSKDHLALDVVRSTGNNNSVTATIIAIDDGIVTAQRKWVKNDTKNPPGEGNCVYIKHANGYTSKVYHLAPDSVPDYIYDNAIVKKGQVLGKMGNTGYSFGAHTHFQVEDTKGKCVDPEGYLTGQLNFRDDAPDPLEKYKDCIILKCVDPDLRNLLATSLRNVLDSDTFEFEYPES